ncbi:MAG: hypothetical protein A2X61_07355 [Ignavibacteria bacterium GWB2_35_12]|nr:MAG: hypothetical protein A2X63_08590 [Ignavibacteria bacterium GWA2_35_8]OGU39294.1 MAG: hypothetical protein A2X61_07355 [Ignavibacteria bacterium GWB2_35_12]OGU95936.1 MAG: hypothetical protein A2220_15080 [Ignavibacteria bacterium RIFOXYA2_FULL_35_10]OGV21177.1 MAG: hypothetical protein A2475_01455 [Ignavibacteria bacterium RIFOXYC2_FULL_35_21]
MIEQFKKDLKIIFPKELVDALLDSYIEIKTNFIIDKWEPSELNGGKFVEATIRIIQFACFGGLYTPISTSIRNIFSELQRIERAPTTVHDSYRLHIPRCIGAIYNIRNRRGVGHLSGDINPNKADALLIITISEWVLAELYRLNYKIPFTEAQTLVNNLVSRKLELIFELNGIKRILNPHLTLKDQILLLLYAETSQFLKIDSLCINLKYKNKTYIKRNLLTKLDKLQYIELTDDDKIYLLPPGSKYVEDNYNYWKL